MHSVVWWSVWWRKDLDPFQCLGNWHSLCLAALSRASNTDHFNEIEFSLRVQPRLLGQEEKMWPTSILHVLVAHLAQFAWDALPSWDCSDYPKRRTQDPYCAPCWSCVRCMFLSLWLASAQVLLLWYEAEDGYGWGWSAWAAVQLPGVEPCRSWRRPA